MIFKKIRGVKGAFRATAGKRTYTIRAVGGRGTASPERYQVTVAFSGEAQLFTTRAEDNPMDRLAAMEFCEAVAAGDIDIEEMRQRYIAEDIAAEEAANRRADADAREFRDLLDRWGLKYTDLLDLVEKQQSITDMVHRRLLAMEGVGTQ